MTAIPRRITVQCQGCRAIYKPKKLRGFDGMCVSCPGTKWHLQAEYEIFENSGGESNSLAANVGINAIGIGLLATTGTGFVGSVGGSGEPKSTGRHSIADIYDVDGKQLRELCNPPKTAIERLAAFIYQAELDIQRNRMQERGASHCKSCEILFVPTPEKPWTLVGTCSRSCCATLHGTTSYAEIEHQVREATAEASTQIQATKQAATHLEIKCNCGVVTKHAKMYAGTYRKCSACGAKILVPLNE